MQIHIDGMGLILNRPCKRCHVSYGFSDENEYEESIQMGCGYCRDTGKLVKFYPEFVSRINKWVIIEEKTVKRKFRWPWQSAEYKESNRVCLTIINVDGCGHDMETPLFFDRRKEALDYIMTLE